MNLSQIKQDALNETPADPPTTIALVEEVERLRAEIDRLNEMHSDPDPGPCLCAACCNERADEADRQLQSELAEMEREEIEDSIRYGY